MKDKFYEEILLSEIYADFLYDITKCNECMHYSLGHFSYEAYGQESNAHVFYVFEYGLKYIYLCYSTGSGVSEEYDTDVIVSLEELEEIFKDLKSAYKLMYYEWGFGYDDDGGVGLDYWVKGKKVKR